jgi:hypothetical protein
VSRPRILDSPEETRLRLLASTSDPAELAHLAIGAVFRFAVGLGEPLSAALWLACCDAETGLPSADGEPDRPFRVLRRAELPPGVDVRPLWEGEQVETAGTLTEESLGRWATAALAADCGADGDLHACWQELALPVFRVRLPRIVDASSRGIRVAQGAGELVHPVEAREDGLHVSGPMPPRTLDAPIGVKIVNQAGLLTFDVALRWSLWAGPDAPGRADVDAALERLHALGWGA